MATFEQFEATFGLLKEVNLTEQTLHKEGYIAKVKTTDKNAAWRGFIFQDDDNSMYSITLTSKVPPDLTEAIKSIQPRAHVNFFYRQNTKDGKIYNNICGVEFIQGTKDDLPPELEPDTSRSTKHKARSNFTDLSIIAQVALKEANSYRGYVLVNCPDKPMTKEEAVELTKQYARTMYELVNEELERVE